MEILKFIPEAECIRGPLVYRESRMGGKSKPLATPSSEKPAGIIGLTFYGGTSDEPSITTSGPTPTSSDGELAPGIVGSGLPLESMP